jgi:hypothetical protein
MTKAHLLLFLLVSVVGCASIPERAANECKAQGFEPGTQEYSQCYQMAYRTKVESVRMMQQGLSMMGQQQR